MELPFGKIEGNVLRMSFSTADYSIATVLSALKEHLDVIKEMGVKFLGAQTEISVQPGVFQPVPIVIIFEYEGKEKAENVLKKVYELVWEGMVSTFPDESAWSEAKANFAEFIFAQAELLRARVESMKTE